MFKILQTNHLIPTLLASSMSLVLLTACGSTNNNKPKVPVSEDTGGSTGGSTDGGTGGSTDGGTGGSTDGGTGGSTDGGTGGSTDGSTATDKLGISATLSLNQTEFPHAEDGRFVTDSTSVKHCSAEGKNDKGKVITAGLKDGEHCGLVSFEVTANLSKLLKVDPSDPVSFDYKLVDSDGKDVSAILKDSGASSTGTIKLHKESIQQALYFELKSDGEAGGDWNLSLEFSNPSANTDLSTVNKPLVSNIVIKDADSSGGGNSGGGNSGGGNSGGGSTTTDKLGISATLTLGQTLFTHAEDGRFITDDSGVKHCSAEGKNDQGVVVTDGLKDGEHCGLVSFDVTSDMDELLKTDPSNPVSFDYKLVDSDGKDVSAILKDSGAPSTGTIELHKDNVQQALYFELKSDDKADGDWSLSLEFSNPSDNADLSTVNTPILSNIVIKDAHVAVSKINDTGVTYSAGLDKGTDTGCSSATQDCNFGRDKDSNGFDFVKLDAAGEELDESATEWSCVKDKTTGLVWERKTYAEKDEDAGYRDSRWDYGYYNAEQGLGDELNEESTDSWGTKCGGIGNCTTASYTTKMNTDKLCGTSSWRLPTRLELFDVANLNTKDTEKVMQAQLLSSIFSVPGEIRDNQIDSGKTKDDYVDTSYKRVRTSYWTSSVAMKMDYSGNTAFDALWTMYPDGSFTSEKPKGNYSNHETAMIAVADGK